MFLRRLRITVSVFFVLLAVGLSVLWVRSIWHRDSLWMQRNGWYSQVTSVSGAISFFREPRDSTAHYWNGSTMQAGGPLHWTFAKHLIGDWALPYWFTVLVAVALAVLPWMIRIERFSLRTLFIVTAIIAVALELFVITTWVSGLSAFSLNLLGLLLSFAGTLVLFYFGLPQSSHDVGVCIGLEDALC